MADKFGGGIVTRTAWLLGQVADYFPDTHTYNVIASGHLFQGVQRILEDPGSASALPRNTLVAMHQELGTWVIAGVLNQGAAARSELTPVSITEYKAVGANDPVALKGAGDARAVNAPKDLAPGDWVKHGPLGNLIALLAGGDFIAKASPLAQFRALGAKDQVEIISHLFRHITAMGQSEVKTDGDRVTYTWRGGANTQQTGLNAENWTIRIDMGATEGGELVSLEVTTPEGQTLARIAISPDGRLAYGGTALDVYASGGKSETIAGDVAELVEGSKREKVAKSKTQAYGERTTEISKTDATMIGGNKQTTIRQDDARFVGGLKREKVLGGGLVPPPMPGSKAGVVEFVNGGIEVTIGSPLSGALPLQQAAQWVNYQGGFHFAVMPSAAPWPIGGYTVMSSMPSSVHLGVDGAAIPDPTGAGHKFVPVPAVFGVMKFEPWQAMMKVLLKLLDTHQHPTAVGPSGPPMVPMSDVVSALFQLIRSVRVGVGL